jgi:hypothetical protein
MKEKLKEYLFAFMAECDWDNDKIPEQARALFTTLCFVGNIDVDTAECDRILYDLYRKSAIEGQIEFEKYDLFMCELIA